MNTFYGRPAIPIGAVRNGVRPDEGKYLGVVNRKDSHGKSIYPYDLESDSDAPEAVALLRRNGPAR